MSERPLEARLLSVGLNASEARRKKELFTQVDAALASVSEAPREEAKRWFVPGRIEVLGKHTGYAGGRSLLCAVGRGFCVRRLRGRIPWSASWTWAGG